MTLANRTHHTRVSRLLLAVLLLWLGGAASWLVLTDSRGGLISGLERRYGPTTPSGYYVRLEPSGITMAHTQRPRVTVTVEDAAGQPVEGVQVRFTASEGNVTTDTSHTRNGVVTGTFAAATGSDSPRTAFVIVTVEDVDITVFIDIVPAVFGR
jgi:hypothetical protein